MLVASLAGVGLTTQQVDVLRTLTAGVVHREQMIRRIDAVVVQRRDPAGPTIALPRPGGGEFPAERAGQNRTGLTAFRFTASTQSYRRDELVLDAPAEELLRPGPADGPVGRRERPRSVVTHYDDGERWLTLANGGRQVTAMASQLLTPPAAAAVVSQALVLRTPVGMASVSLRLYLHQEDSVPVGDLGFEPESEVAVRSLETAEFEGQPCYLLTAPGQQINGPICSLKRMWIAPSLGCAVLRAESFLRDDTAGWAVARARSGRGFEEVAPGLWLPRESRWEVVKHDPGQPPTRREIEENLILKIVVNGEPPPEWEALLPFGALVRDSITGREYVAGPLDMKAIDEFRARPWPEMDPALAVFPDDEMPK